MVTLEMRLAGPADAAAIGRFCPTLADRLIAVVNREHPGLVVVVHALPRTTVMDGESLTGPSDNPFQHDAPTWGSPSWDNPQWEGSQWDRPSWQNPSWEGPDWQDPAWSRPGWTVSPSWDLDGFRVGALGAPAGAADVPHQPLHAGLWLRVDVDASLPGPQLPEVVGVVALEAVDEDPRWLGVRLRQVAESVSSPLTDEAIARLLERLCRASGCVEVRPLPSWAP